MISTCGAAQRPRAGRPRSQRLRDVGAAWGFPPPGGLRGAVWALAYHYPHSLGFRGVEGDLTVVGSGLYDIRGVVGDVEAVAGDRVGFDGERHVNGLAGVGLGIGEVVAVETHRVGGELQHGAIPGYVNILL